MNDYNKPFSLLFHSSSGQCHACKGIDFIVSFHEFHGLYAYHINATIQACTNSYVYHLANPLNSINQSLRDIMIRKDEDE